MFVVVCLWCGNDLRLSEIKDSAPAHPCCDECHFKAVHNYVLGTPPETELRPRSDAL